MSPTASKPPGLHIAYIGAEHTTFLGFSEERENPGGGHTTPDDSFIRHDAYFFKDGNVTFLVGGTLYCLGIRDHEALPTIISIGDVERKDFEALLSVLYPTNFEAHELTYEQWKSVLHLSTRWGFASLRKHSLKSITPPTPHDQFVLARTYSVDHWVLPALTALCERSLPLSLDEARQMSTEDVVLVARVREEIRGGVLRVDAADIRYHIEMAQAGKPSHPVGDDIHWDAQKNEATGQKSDSTVASPIDPNVEAEIAETTGVALPSGPQQRGMKEGDTKFQTNHQEWNCPVWRNAKLEVALPKAAALSLAKAAFAENHAVRAMAGQEAEENANAETMRRIEAEAAKERADAEEKARGVQEEAVRARERVYAEAKKAAVEARKGPLTPQVPAIPTHKIDPPPATGDPREEWWLAVPPKSVGKPYWLPVRNSVDFLAVRATESTGVRFFSWVGNKSVFPTTSDTTLSRT
ncbi:hypothetical protein EDB84DRAFT_1575693 [Lactarius hengduanensis]|nr:hypothetical protein EDB84DRAFT_1575693 [Lactarius hengduanensis]